MGLWSTVISCWFLGSVPLAVLVGKSFAARDYPAVAVDEPAVDVDAFLERVFAG